MSAPESSNDADILAFANALGALLVKAAEAGARKALEQMPPLPPGGDNKAESESSSRKPFEDFATIV